MWTRESIISDMRKIVRASNAFGVGIFGFSGSRWDVGARATTFSAELPRLSPGAVLAAAADFAIARPDDAELQEIILQGLMAGFLMHQQDRMDGFAASADEEQNPVDASALIRYAVCFLAWDWGSPLRFLHQNYASTLLFAVLRKDNPAGLLASGRPAIGRPRLSTALQPQGVTRALALVLQRNHILSRPVVGVTCAALVASLEADWCVRRRELAAEPTSRALLIPCAHRSVTTDTCSHPLPPIGPFTGHPFSPASRRFQTPPGADRRLGERRLALSGPHADR